MVHVDLMRPGDGRYRCEICFKLRTPEQLFTDANGDTWDICNGECAEKAGLT